MINEKYNEENTKKIQELTKKLEEEFARRNYLLTQMTQIIASANKEQEKQLFELWKHINSENFVQPFPSDADERKIIRGVFELLIERAQSVIAAGYDGLGVQDLKHLAFNEYGIDMDKNNG